MSGAACSRPRPSSEQAPAPSYGPLTICGAACEPETTSGGGATPPVPGSVPTGTRGVRGVGAASQELPGCARTRGGATSQW